MDERDEFLRDRLRPAQPDSTAARPPAPHTGEPQYAAAGERPVPRDPSAAPPASPQTPPPPPVTPRSPRFRPGRRRCRPRRNDRAAGSAAAVGAAATPAAGSPAARCTSRA